MTTIREIALVLKAHVPFEFQDGVVTELAIDSRKIVVPSQALFFAIAGDRHDGHRFIAEVYAKGVRAFVVNNTFVANQFDDAVFLSVDDTLIALQQVAATKRNASNIPVVGITGSNGKTIVKEWLYQMLSPDVNIVRSPKSYNSQVGVPLSVWKLGPEHGLALFEAGISEPGEMIRLERVIRPTIGILTNLGHAHDENFTSLKQKAHEKLDLFQHCDTVIYCKDYLIIEEELAHYVFVKRPRMFTWSKKFAADLQVGRIEKHDGQTSIQAIYKHRFIRITIPFIDEASIENAIHCWALLLVRGVNDEKITERMLLLTPVAMRLELKQGLNNCSVINDTYNSDLQSISIALDFLEQQHQHPKRTLILSDILQTGRTDSELYAEVAALLQQKQVHRIIGIGPHISAQSSLFQSDASFFPNTDAFLNALPNLVFQDEAILLKGARPFGFEAIGQVLQQKTHQTVLEVDLGAIVHNLNLIRSLLKPETKLMAMVKASGYGSGSFEIARVLQFHRVHYLAVAYADEGIELRKAGITLPIMVMSPEEHTFDAMIQHDLEPEIYSMHALRALESVLGRGGIPTKPVRVHVKLNTGMNRLGFHERDLNELCVRLANNRSIDVASIFSHLAASDTPSEDAFTRQQIAALDRMSSIIMQHLGKTVPRHICNSFGILRFPEAQFDMVRLGIGLYGVAPDSPISHLLRNVSTLKSTITQLHHLQLGDSVGYGRLERVLAPMVTATIPVGYADGLNRKHGNRKGHILVNGEPAPIIGSVCMDMVMVDVTDIPCNEGDEVIIFGEGYPIEEFARNAETISYEVLTGISSRVKRVYFQE